MSSTQQWPSDLPVPHTQRVEGHSSLARRTRMETGRLRVRPIELEEDLRVRAVWEFTLDEFSDFLSFFSSTLLNGEYDFEMEAPVGETVTYSFADANFTVSRADGHFSVEAVLLVTPEPPYVAALCNMADVDSGDSFECYPVGWTGSMYGGEMWDASWSFAGSATIWGDDMEDYSSGDTPSNGGAGFARNWAVVSDIDPYGEDFESYSVGGAPSGGGTGLVGSWSIL